MGNTGPQPKSVSDLPYRLPLFKAEATIATTTTATTNSNNKSLNSRVNYDIESFESLNGSLISNCRAMKSKFH
jgi:hypothetical protein